MTYSAVGLAGEVSKGAAGTPEVVVEPGAGGEREELGRDPGTEAVQGSGVAFEFELVFESPEDRFDALADRCEMRAAAGLVGSSGREHDRVVALVDGGRELFAGVAFVGDDRLPPRKPIGSSRIATSRSFWSAGARIAARGVPSGAARRCSRIPQNHRLWLRQYP
jgi:hypothetical protein